MSAIQCITCRWWNGDKTYAAEAWAERDRHGKCHHIHASAALPDDWPVHLYPVGTNAWLETRFDFSCRDWENDGRGGKNGQLSRLAKTSRAETLAGMGRDEVSQPLPREIWLEPRCDKCINLDGADERSWCEDNAFEPCPECGKGGIRYVIDRRQLPRGETK